MTRPIDDGFEPDFDAQLSRWLDRQGERHALRGMSELEVDRLLELARVDASLPASFGERLRARLELARDLGPELDALLDVASTDGSTDAPPAGLARRALQHARGELALDALLDALPQPLPPLGLGQRVLAFVRERERRAQARRLGAFAAAIAAGALLLIGLRWSDRAIDESSEALAGVELAPGDLELLRELELLEDWEEVTDPELLLDVLDPFDGLLLDLDAGAAAGESK